MEISYDPAKRAAAPADRKLDFIDAAVVFAGPTVDLPDSRFDYGEDRVVTFGLLAARMVVVVWTPRGSRRHIISMRKANGRERARYQERLG